MKFVVLNPNTTRAMTDAVLADLGPRLPAGSTLFGMTAPSGPAVIDSRDTYAAGAVGALAMLADVPADAEGILLACFGDPGLQQLRQATAIPVVGLAEAAMAVACAARQRFAIITAGSQWVGLLEDYALACGATAFLSGVYALAGNGNTLMKNPDAFRAQLLALSGRAADDGAQALILGGAAFAGLDFRVDPRLALVDPMTAAAQALARQT